MGSLLPYVYYSVNPVDIFTKSVLIGLTNLIANVKRDRIAFYNLFFGLYIRVWHTTRRDGRKRRRERRTKKCSATTAML